MLGVDAPDAWLNAPSTGGEGVETTGRVSGDSAAVVIPLQRIFGSTCNAWQEVALTKLFAHLSNNSI